MAEISEIVREALVNALQGVGGGSDGKPEITSSNGGSGLKGLAAGAGAAALAPIVLKKLGGLNGLGGLLKSPGGALGGAASKIGDRVTSAATDKAKEAVDDAGGPAGILKDAAKSVIPGIGGGGGNGGGGGGKQDAEGVGKGRRMPIQQAVDIALPIDTVYNQWTQVEEWPKFMHRVTRVSQEDPCKVSFAVKIWGRTKEFTAEIDTQRPDDRIKWKTTDGMNHTGVVAFRELGPNLTRVQLSFDLDPGGLLEKYARGARYVKRAARADLHRFAAFIEMLEHETGAWRGVIEDGEVVEDHDPSYDEDREYASADELIHGRGSESDDEEDEEGEDDEDSEDEDSEDEEESGDRGESSRPRRSSRRAKNSGGSSGSRGRGSSAKAQSRSSGSASRSSSGGGSSNRGSASGRSSRGRSSGNGGSGSRSGSSSSGRGSSGRSTSRSSGSSRGSNASRGRSSGSGRSSSGGSQSSGGTRSRGGSRSSSNSASEHQGRSRSRSSRRG